MCDTITAVGGHFTPRAGRCAPATREAGGVVVMPDDLERLAGLIQIKNEADAAIADLIGRPAAPGNIKTYSGHESVLDISPHPSDCYLVLTGPAGQARVLPWSSTRCSCSTASNCWPRSQPAVSRSASPPACGNRTGKPHGSTRRSQHPRCNCPAPRSPALNSSRPHTPQRTTETSTAAARGQLGRQFAARLQHAGKGAESVCTDPAQ
jgi:hypothetical protein